MASLYLPKHVRCKMAEDFAIRIRDQVNSTHADRLAIEKFVDYETEVDIFFRDRTFNAGEFLNIVWEPGKDWAETVQIVLNTFPSEEDEEEVNTTDL